MASLHKDPRGRSPYWYCAFYGADGRRKLKSTKTSSRKTALQVCAKWEETAGEARKGLLTAAQLRKVMAEMLSVSSGEELPHFTVSKWLNDWLENKQASASPSTMLRYKQVVRDFLKTMGSRANTPLAGVTPSDIARFRDTLRKEGRAVTTCNMVVKKILSVPFEAARRQGYIPTNPTAAVDRLSDRDHANQGGKETFTEAELARLLEHASGDWKGAIILGAHTGLRLGDVSSLCWESIDLEEGLLSVVTQKTGQKVTIAISQDFSEWLANTPKGIGKAPVFTELHSTAIGGRKGLSSQFRLMMDEVGVKYKTLRRHGKKGRDRNSKGFHSLRHTFISALANAGVPKDVRQKIVGQLDEKVHAHYTHLEIDTFRAAIAKLPRLN